MKKNDKKFLIINIDVLFSAFLQLKFYFNTSLINALNIDAFRLYCTMF